MLQTRRPETRTVDAFVDFVGTAGSFTGIARFLKGKTLPICCYVVELSSAAVLSRTPIRKLSHTIEGGGYGFIAAFFGEDKDKLRIERRNELLGHASEYLRTLDLKLRPRDALKVLGSGRGPSSRFIGKLNSRKFSTEKWWVRWYRWQSAVYGWQQVINRGWRKISSGVLLQAGRACAFKTPRSVAEMKVRVFLDIKRRVPPFPSPAVGFFMRSARKTLCRDSSTRRDPPPATTRNPLAAGPSMVRVKVAALSGVLHILLLAVTSYITSEQKTESRQLCATFSSQTMSQLVGFSLELHGVPAPQRHRTDLCRSSFIPCCKASRTTTCFAACSMKDFAALAKASEAHSVKQMTFSRGSEDATVETFAHADGSGGGSTTHKLVCIGRLHTEGEIGCVVVTRAAESPGFTWEDAHAVHSATEYAFRTARPPRSASVPKAIKLSDRLRHVDVSTARPAAELLRSFVGVE